MLTMFKLCFFVECCYSWIKECYFNDKRKMGRFRLYASVVTIVVKVNKAIHLYRMMEVWENWGCNSFQKHVQQKYSLKNKKVSKHFLKAKGFNQPWITGILRNALLATMV